jgi:excisionase family DNA binding protein
MNNMNSIITTRKLDRLVYTTKESAKMLCISQKSVYRLIQRGKLRCISSLRHKRIPRSELERFLKEDLN